MAKDISYGSPSDLSHPQNNGTGIRPTRRIKLLSSLHMQKREMTGINMMSSKDHQKSGTRALDPKPGDYLTKKQLAELLHVSTRTVNNYVTTGQIPAPIHVGRLALWSKAALGTFLASLELKP